MQNSAFAQIKCLSSHEFESCCSLSKILEQKRKKFIKLQTDSFLLVHFSSKIIRCFLPNSESKLNQQILLISLNSEFDCG